MLLFYYLHDCFCDSNLHSFRPAFSPDQESDSIVGIHCHFFDETVGVCVFVSDNISEGISFERFLENLGRDFL